MKKISFIITVMVIVACANISIDAKRYDSHVDPDVFITWQSQPVGFDKYGYLHVFFKNPEAGEPEVIEGAMQKYGNQWVLVMYRYRYKGQMYVFALTEDNRYTQVHPKQSHI